MNPLARVKDPDRLRDLLGAVLAIGADLSLPNVLRTICETATQVTGCRYGALGVVSQAGGGLSEFVHVGMDASEAATIGRLPEGHGILGVLIVDPVPLRLADLGAHPDRYGFPAGHPQMHSFLGVPIRIRAEVYGNLYLTEKLDGGGFSEEDEGLAESLAAAAAIAIDNARLHARVQELTLVGDRERIAADLHDTVIQRIFATGLGLQAALRIISPPEAAARVDQAVADLDETIRQIRSTIFGLQTQRLVGRSLRTEILGLVSEAAASLRFDPEVRFDGPIDTSVPDEAAVHLLAVLREALSNVVRHAGASRVEVVVSVTDGYLTVEVHDDGIGMAATGRPGGRGLANLGQRAATLGGSVSLTAGPAGAGTTVAWRVPLHRPAD